MKKRKTESKPSGSIDNHQESDFFSSLPDEIIFEIFRGLSKKELKHCSAVCRRFRKISSDCRLELWRKVSIQHEAITLERLAEVIERGVRTLQLFRITVTDSDTGGEPFTANYDSNLEELIAVRPNISAFGLASIIECTSHLVKLDISRCTFDQSIANAISKNTGLQILRLNGCTFLDEMVITTILKGCEKIKELELCWTRLSTEVINAMIPHLSASISHLDLCYCGPYLVDKHLRAISKTCPNLEKLEITGNTGLSSIATDH